MYKMMFTWKDSREIPLQQAEEHYRTTHTKLGTLGLEGANGFRAYVQNRVLATTIYDFNDPTTAHSGEPDFNRFVELYFEDEATALAHMGKGGGATKLFDDHPHFMDVGIPGSLKIYVVSEVVAAHQGDWPR